MKKFLKKKIISWIFQFTFIAKSVIGFFEIIAGIIMATSGRFVVNDIIISLAQQEILGDPDDVIVNYLITISNNFSGAINLFAVVYLFSHGIINVFLAVALLKNKLWVYSWAIAGFGLFIIYQIFRYFHTYSLTLLLLTIFDIFIVSIILLEYKKKKITTI
jgi:uncharacterized membrane protein